MGQGRDTWKLTSRVPYSVSLSHAIFLSLFPYLCAMKWTFAVVAAAFALFSCGRKDTGRFEALLQQPPYKVYTDSIHKEPKRASLYFSRAGLLTQGHETEAALADFEKAYTLESNDLYAWAYGSTLINLQRYDSAINLLKKATLSFPNNLNIKERLAYTYNLAKKPNEALKVYDEILALDSTDFRSWAAKAYIYQDMDDDAKALEAFKRSYLLYPTQASGEEIAFMMAQNKNPETIAFCRALIKQDSAATSVQPYYCMGLYYKNTGNTPEAIKQFDYCIRTDYSFPDPYLDKGEIFYNEKKYSEALKVFQLVKTSNNTYADAYFWAGKCYEAMGKKSEAKLEYERAFALDKDFAEAKEAAERVKN